MNTNNAPERIALPNGIHLSLTRSPMGNPLWYDIIAKDGTVLFRGNGNSGFKEQLAFAAAMRPQVSEGHEAVVSEMLMAYADNVKYGALSALKSAINVYAKHRQPAAVSADAEKLNDTNVVELVAKRIYAECATYDQAIPYIQAYGDACRLDGARKMFSALIEELESGSESDYRTAQAIKHNRALSPETVCGGGE